MIALDSSKTVRYRSLNDRSSQIWEAASADGLWFFERIEDTGTHWIAHHAVFGRVSLFVSLPQARRLAEAALALQVAWSLAAIAGGWT